MSPASCLLSQAQTAGRGLTEAERRERAGGRPRGGWSTHHALDPELPTTPGEVGLWNPQVGELLAMRPPPAGHRQSVTPLGGQPSHTQ